MSDFKIEFGDLIPSMVALQAADVAIRASVIPGESYLHQLSIVTPRGLEPHLFVMVNFRLPDSEDGCYRVYETCLCAKCLQSKKFANGLSKVCFAIRRDQANIKAGIESPPTVFRTEHN